MKMPEIGKKLNELRVCDLKDELEKRGVDTIGSKVALLERLQSALKSEGKDPNTFVFQPPSKTNKKGAAQPVEKDVEAEEEELVHIKEEPVDEEEETNGQEYCDENTVVDEVGTVDEECVLIDDEDEYFNNGDEQTAEEVDEVVIEEEEEEEENTGDGTNQDNEESINLTIGEDEQQLLHDEAPDDKVKSKANEQAKAVRKESNGKADAEDKGDNTGKDEKKEIKDDEASKNKMKKDEQSNDKEESSEQKSTSKASHKDDKEKTVAASSNAASTNAAGETSKTGSGGKTSTPSRNLWVSGLSSITRASDLKTIFSKFGKVIGAKVVTNTRTPGTRCYGYVTMSSSSDAGRCIEHLHRTELHGRIISVERTKNEIGGSASNGGNRSANNSNSGPKRRDDDKRKMSDDKKKADDKKSSTHGGRRDEKSSRDEKDKENKADTNDAGKEKDKENDNTSAGKRISRRSTRSVDGKRGDRNRDHDRERERERVQRQRERERERIRQREILSYQKIREERERQRLREKERELREEERRRREIRERQRQEEQRLAEERKKLALERERLEKEKAELLRLERERQKLEREKIELERLELKRQQMKIIQSRDDPVKRTVKRSTDDRYPEAPDRKRSSGNENRFEAPPPPRFDAALVSSRSYDKKRDDYSGSSTTKRSIDDYSSSKRTEYPSKRDDYSSSGTKRAAVDDYAPAPPKRSNDDYSKRSSDYISSTGSKRGLDDYSSSNKRDDYSSSKLQQRDEYKREVEIRHITASGTSGGVSSYVHKSSGTRYAEPEVQVRSSITSFRRVDDRGDTRTTSGSKRYDGSSGYGGGSNGTWTPSTSSHLGHVSGSGAPTLKSYVSNGISSNVHGSNSVWQKSSGTAENNWRPLASSHDRYDRTYNERSGGYMDSSRPGGMYGSGRATTDRYGGTVSSRYDGKY